MSGIPSPSKRRRLDLDRIVNLTTNIAPLKTPLTGNPLPKLHAGGPGPRQELAETLSATAPE